MIEITSHEIFSDIKIIKPKVFIDKRGFFTEIYNKKTFEINGLKLDFVQDNYSFTEEKWVIRGLHFQYEPFAKDKLVRVLNGKILDVFVDIRKNSSTYKKWGSYILDQKNQEWLLVPKGFAHGFLTLDNKCNVLYKVTDFYNAEKENGIIWNDEQLSIDWYGIKNPILSDKDMELKKINEI
jgi:dTDP-4-dehydrorhamnose 3,5-epimerase